MSPHASHRVRAIVRYLSTDEVLPFRGFRGARIDCSCGDMYDLVIEGDALVERPIHGGPRGALDIPNDAPPRRARPTQKLVGV